MSKTRYFAVLNPAAGGGRCKKRAPAALDRLRADGLDLTVAETKRPGHAQELVRAAWAEGFRDFLAVGGDGTSYEVVNGLFSGGALPAERPSLGFLPLGTGNSFLRDYADDGAEHAAAALRSGSSRPCDIFRLEHEEGVLHYLNLLSVGYVADVCALTNRRFKRLGETGYVFGVMGELLRLRPRPLPMALDGGPHEQEPAAFVSVCNSRFTGGKMMMAPEADASDGLADVIRVGPMSRWQLFRTFPKIFKGLHVKHPLVTTARARSIDFDLPEPLDAMIDGEVLRIRPTRLEVLPGLLDVRV